MKYRKVFYDLYKSEKGLLAFTLYGRYGVKPIEAVEFINEYKGDGIISVDENHRICLTSKGKEKISSILKTLVQSHTDSPPYLTNMMCADRIKPFEPYLPDKEFYNRYIKERDEKETSK